MNKYILIVVSLLLLLHSGCTYKSTYTIGTDNGKFKSFKGLKDIFPDDTRKKRASDVTIYYVHGMGVHPSDEKDTLDFFRNIAREMGFSREKVDGRHNLTLGGETLGDVTLLTYRGKRRNFTLVSLSWSQTTKKVEDILNRNSNPYGNRIAWGNKKLKQVMNEGFADAVLYLNPKYRELIFKAIRMGINKAYALKPQLRGKKNVLVSSSLGSKVVFDAMRKYYMIPGTVRVMKKRDIDGTKRYILKTITLPTSPYSDFFDNLEQVYMTSNQLPLLDLSGVHTSSGTVKKTQLIKSARELRTMKSVSKSSLRQMKSAVSRRKKTKELPIIAFSDPNDALSYHITTEDMGIVKFTSVTISHAKIWWFGVLANPLKAHSGMMQVEHGYKTLVHGSEYLKDKFQKYKRVPMESDN